MSTSRLRKLLLPLLRGYIAGKPRTFARMETARQGIFLLQKPVSLKSKAAKVRQRSEKQSARQSHNQETAAIREAALGRSGGQCEVPGCRAWFSVVAPAELDHWESGIGRRRQRQAVENTWLICRSCHRQKTENFPNPAWWNEEFGLHCKKHGYQFRPRLIHAEPAKAGGAP